MERFKFIKETSIEDKVGKIFEKIKIKKDETENKAEWFEEGETAYLNPDLSAFDFTENITTGETDEESKEFMEGLIGTPVTIKSIEQREESSKYGKPTEVIVTLENGADMKFPTIWLTHKKETQKQVKAADDNGSHLILKRKHGSSYWQYYTEVFSVSDFNLRFEDSVFDYYEGEDNDEILRCTNWEDVDNVLNTVESSAQDADFWLLKVIEVDDDYLEEYVDGDASDTEYTFLCEDVYGKQIKVKFEGYPSNSAYAEIV